MSSSFDPVPSDRLEVTKEEGAALTDFDYRVMASILKMTHALRWPKDTLSYLTERIGLEGFQVPVSQLSGFTQFVAQPATTIAAYHTTVSTVYTNLTTTGPELTGLPNGKYLLFYGCTGQVSATGYVSSMSIQVNAVTATDADAVVSPFVNLPLSSSIAVAKDLTSGDNNTVTAKYRIQGGDGVVTAGFENRWMIALKYAEL